MEPITTVAGTIAALILGEAFKEGGKSLGKGASEKITQLFKVIREKLKLAGTWSCLGVRDGSLASFRSSINSFCKWTNIRSSLNRPITIGKVGGKSSSFHCLGLYGDHHLMTITIC